jgi:hypothetical protein
LPRAGLERGGSRALERCVRLVLVGLEESERQLRSLGVKRRQSRIGGANRGPFVLLSDKRRKWRVFTDSVWNFKINQIQTLAIPTYGIYVKATAARRKRGSVRDDGSYSSPLSFRDPMPNLLSAFFAALNSVLRIHAGLQVEIGAQSTNWCAPTLSEETAKGDPRTELQALFLDRELRRLT